jgi:transcriptional regulator with XRE-family HTH domain
MLIGDRLKKIRESRKMSQGDIERKSGLSREFVSKIENGHAMPVITTLEKMACAMEVPLYVLFYDGEKAPPPTAVTNDEVGWGSKGAEARALNKFREYLGRSSPRDRKLLLLLASRMAARNRS